MKSYISNFQPILVNQNGNGGIKCETALSCMSQHLTEDKSTLVQVMAWCRQATNHYPSHCWPRSLSPYGITRPQCVIVWQVLHFDSNFTLVFSKGSRCLTAPSHYLNQSWFIISEALGQSLEGNFTKDTSSITEISLKITWSKISFNSPRGQDLKINPHLHSRADINSKGEEFLEPKKWVEAAAHVQ